MDKKLLEQAVKDESPQVLYDAGFTDEDINVALNTVYGTRLQREKGKAIYGRDYAVNVSKQANEVAKTNLQGHVLDTAAKLTGNEILKEGVADTTDRAVESERKDLVNPAFTHGDKGDSNIILAGSGAPTQTDESYQAPNIEVREQLSSTSTSEQPANESGEATMDKRIRDIGKQSFEDAAKQFNIDVTMESISDIKRAQDSTGEDLAKYMPTSILAAYKKGTLGAPGSDEAKARRNYFVMDAVFKGLSNLGAVIAGRGNPGSRVESAYEKFTGESFQRGMDQYFDTKQKKIDQIISEIERDTSITDEVKKSIIDKINSIEYQTFATKYGEEAASRMRKLMEEFPDFDTEDIEKMYWINVAQGKDVQWQSLVAQSGVSAVTSFLDTFDISW